MSNSALVNYKRLSPNCSSRNGSKIDKITIHHMAGNLSVETCGNVFAPASRQASSHYGIGSDGRVGQYVDESMRAWTSSSYENDRRAVTIEVADDSGAPGWHISDKAMAKLIDLCVDICRRNGIKALNYTGNASGNLTRHDMFAATNCPGPYLGSKFPYIASEVNKRLNGGQAAAPAPTPGKRWVQDTILRVGDRVKSVSCAITGVRGSLVNVPALGGGVPAADLVAIYKEKKVIAIDAARDLCKCEGCDYWIKCGPLMAWRADSNKWVQDTILRVGDRVKSVSCAITNAQGNLINVPALGGGVPTADLVAIYKEKKVIAIDAARDLCKCEGCDYWIKCGPLMALR